MGTVTVAETSGNGNGIPEPGETLTLTIPLTNVATATADSVTATLGATVVDFEAIAGHATTTKPLTFVIPMDASCGALLDLPVTFASPSGSNTRSIFVRLGSANPPTPLFSEDFDTVPAPDLPAGWSTTTTGDETTAWHTLTMPLVDAAQNAGAIAPASITDSSLVSPVVSIVANSTARLTFQHRYSMESITFPSVTSLDGGVLEIKIGAGPFADIIAAGGSFVEGGYAGRLDTRYGNPLAGRQCWSGTVSTTVTTIVDLPPGVAGQDVQFRWRIGCDRFPSEYPGWNIDSVTLDVTTFSCAISLADTDMDGIPDEYETAHGFNPNDPADAALDADGDGFTNRQEFLAGTDPRDPESLFRIVTALRNAIDGSVAVTFTSITGKTYRVEYRDDLESGPGWTAFIPNLAGTGGNLVQQDPAAAGKPRRFYRAVLVTP